MKIQKHCNLQFAKVKHPHLHMPDLAEYTIQTFKWRFKAGLAPLHPVFKITEWDCLLQQASMSLNLLHLSTLDSKSLAHAFLHGYFDLKNILAHPGSKVIIYAKPGKRQTWDLNAKSYFI